MLVKILWFKWKQNNIKIYFTACFILEKHTNIEQCLSYRHEIVQTTTKYLLCS